MSRMEVFVIIVTYKGKQWYDRCFGSLRQSTIPVQVIVVDNASDDGTVEYIKEHYPEIILIESKENLGFGRANNMAMRYALDHNCDYVFLLNQDTWIEPNAIEELVRIHEEHPDFGVLSPMHLRSNGKSLYIQIENGRTNHGNKLLADCYFNQLEDVYPFSYVNAAAWLLPRNTLEIVGGFDPIFSHYGEDNDYSNRLQYHGLKLGLCPKVRIVHDHQGSSNPLSGGRMRYYHSLLADFLDPNKKDTIDDYLWYLRRKIILNFLKGKTQEANMLRKDLRFFKGEKTAIKKSRFVNCKKQSSWL